MLNIVRYELFQISFYVGYALIQSRQPGAVKMELIKQLEYFGLETERCNYFPSYGEICRSSYA